MQMEFLAFNLEPTVFHKCLHCPLKQRDLHIKSMINPSYSFFKSYGGYTTASVIGQGDGLFECGISVAPVTDWHYYGNILMKIVHVID